MTDPKSSFSGWDLRVLEETDSTNTYAARLPAWTAVRANIQTGGRGRTRDRRWVSDRGGLWLSAVVPCPGPRSRWEVLPLVVGWAVIGALRDLGVAGSRLRWPNDVMIGNRKLAGLLVERFTDETAVVGIGLNVFNSPDAADPALAGVAVRLSDLVRGELSLDDVAGQVLASLRHQHGRVLAEGFDPIAAELNQAWSAEPRRVAVTFPAATKPVEGVFEGVDAKGRLKLSTASGSGIFDATQVALLRELV